MIDTVGDTTAITALAPTPAVPEPLLQELIRHASLAPSGHNTQPWKFSVSGNVIEIVPDMSRRLSIVDPDDHALYISLGCALENLVIASAAKGLAAAVEYGPGRLRVTLTPNGSREAGALFRAIPVRQSNRSVFDGRALPADHVRQLMAAGIFESVDVKVFRTGEAQIEPIIQFVKQGNIAQFNDKAFVNELVRWIRFSKREVEQTKDGLTHEALGFPSIPRWLGEFIMTRLVKPEREAAKQEKAIRSSALMLLFIARSNRQRNWVDVGRSFERVALTAASLGIALAHVNMPCEVEAIRRRLATHLCLHGSEQPLLLIRLGYAKALPHAPRRPINEVMHAT